MKKTLKNVFLGGALLSSHFLFSQQLPQESLVDWSSAGLQENLPDFDTVHVPVSAFFTDGQTPNDQPLQNLLAGNPGPVVFLFPPGDYFFEKTIHLGQGQVIKGTSATESRFIFDLGGEGHLFSIRGTSTADTVQILADVPKDSSVLSVAGAAMFQPGDFIKIICEDGALVTSAWAEYSTGQICQITHVGDGELTVRPAIRKSLTLPDNPRIVRLAPVQFAGIECLGIERKDSTAQQTSNILFDHAANCWVKGVNSSHCNFAHVTVQHSAHVSVSGSYFHDAFDYGGGGRAYGTVLQFSSSDCLIENNIFNHLRHAMLLQAGANGNVLGYNYSIQPFWTGTNLPDNSAGDLVLHGNYPYCNLFEGNIVQNIVIDDSHGANGPGNVFLRNRAELYGIFMNDDPPSHGQLFIGNEITSYMPFTGFYQLYGTGHFEFGNNVKNTVTPPGTENLTVGSLYLNSDPGYFEGTGLVIGSIGLPSLLNSGNIPARARFLADQMTACEMAPPVVTQAREASRSRATCEIYPNPTTGRLHIRLKNASVKGAEISIFGPTGKLVGQAVTDETGTVSLAHLSPGLYFLLVKNGDVMLCEKVVLTGGGNW